jgi:hypothetical protein
MCIIDQYLVDEALGPLVTQLVICETWRKSMQQTTPLAATETIGGGTQRNLLGVAYEGKIR